MRPRPLALAVLLAAATGCGDSLTDAWRRVALDQEFELRVGESAAVTDELLVITFDGVSSDSRCPLGVLCIQEGDAVVRVRARRLPKSEAVLTLHTQQRLPATFQGFRLWLVLLKPHPLPGKAIAAGDYVATLRVTRP
jgi:hypothetical protein